MRNVPPSLAALIPALILSALTTAEQARADGPKLFFSTQDIADIRSRLDHEPFQSMLDWMLSLDPASGDVPSNPDRSERYGWAYNAHHYATLYLLTGDEAHAAEARQYVLNLTSASQWADNSYRSLGRSMMVRGAAIGYDLTRGSDVWSDAERAQISLDFKAMGDSLLASGGSGWPSGPANNWRAVRYSGAGLAYLATDEPINPAQTIDVAYNQVVNYLTANLTTSTDSAGWKAEPINYNTYPAAFWGTFNQAMMRYDPQRDLTQEVHGAAYAMTSVMFATIPIERGNGLGLVPDFANGHPHYRSEGTAGLSFANIPVEHLPAARWHYDRFFGDGGDQSWDAVDRRMGLFSVLNYPAHVEPVNPAEVLGLTLIDTVNGVALFRDRFQDENDIVAGLSSKHRMPTHVHRGPDLGSVRILGANSVWATGGGGGDPRGQTTIFPYDPLTSSVSNNSATGSLLDALTGVDGSGYAIVQGSSTNTSNHTRRFIVDYSSRSGADALFVIADTSDNGQWWRWNTGGMNDLALTDDGFTLTSPDGGKLFAWVLHGDTDTLRTGTFNRGGNLNFEGQSYPVNKWVDFFSDDGDFLVLAMLMRDGAAPPAFEALGEGIDQTITVGDQRITIDPVTGITMGIDLEPSRSLALLLEHWDQSVPAGAANMGDLTGDGYVGLRDASALLAGWPGGGGGGAGAGGASTIPIPEPATLAQLAPGALLLLRRRR